MVKTEAEQQLIRAGRNIRGAATSGNMRLETIAAGATTSKGWHRSNNSQVLDTTSGGGATSASIRLEAIAAGATTSKSWTQEQLQLLRAATSGSMRLETIAAGATTPKGWTQKQQFLAAQAY
jgi:hypothetical protein